MQYSLKFLALSTGLLAVAHFGIPSFLWDATAIAEVGEPDEVESWRDNSRSGSGVLRVKTPSQIISEADRGSIHLTARQHCLVAAHCAVENNSEQEELANENLGASGSVRTEVVDIVGTRVGENIDPDTFVPTYSRNWVGLDINVEDDYNLVSGDKITVGSEELTPNE